MRCASILAALRPCKAKSVPSQFRWHGCGLTRTCSEWQKGGDVLAREGIEAREGGSEGEGEGGRVRKGEREGGRERAGRHFDVAVPIWGKE